MNAIAWSDFSPVKKNSIVNSRHGFFFIAAQSAVLDRTITKVMKKDKPDKKVSIK